LVLADGNQSLAAKPGFHGDPPQRGGFGMRAVRRFPDHPPKSCGQQPEIDLALAPFHFVHWLKYN
jgi:hypothetical protein